MNFNLFDDLDDRVIYNRNYNKNPFIPENMPNSENMNEATDMTDFPPKTPLAMAYVPFQQWGNVYDSNEAFDKGTLFADLDFPFMRGGNKNE